MPATALNQASSPAAGDELARAVRALGRDMNLDVLAASEKLYRPLHSVGIPATTKLHRDLAYGSDERHRLDVFEPVGAAAGRRPILMFVHGGGFVRGDKTTAGSPFHDNIALWANRNGMVGVNMTYRLAPKHVWPAGAEDVAAAVRWLRSHAGEFGGDPDRIVVMGHSAGAGHVAAYVADDGLHGADGPGIAGAILGSGSYNLATVEPSAVYYGSDPARYAERSSLEGLTRARVPLMLFISELDPPRFQGQALEVLNARFARDARLPRFVSLSRQNHYTATMLLNTDAGDELGTQILDFVTYDCGG